MEKVNNRLISALHKSAEVLRAVGVIIFIVSVTILVGLCGTLDIDPAAMPPGDLVKWIIFFILGAALAEAMHSLILFCERKEGRKRRGFYDDIC